MTSEIKRSRFEEYFTKETEILKKETSRNSDSRST